MHMKHKSCDLLCSCIFATAWKGHADLNLAETLLDKMPALKRIFGGSSIRYELLEGPKRHAELEFSKNGIAIYYWFERPNHNVYAENMLKLLTIASYLRDAYAIDMTSIYGHLIESLYAFNRIYAEPQGQTRNIGLLIKQLSIISDINVRLSAENAAALKKAESLEELNKTLEIALMTIVSAIAARFPHNNPKEALASIGIEKDMITIALKCCKGEKLEKH